MTTAKRVGGFPSFRECVLTITNRVRIQQRFGEWVFFHRKACRRLAKLWRVCFDHCKLCKRLADVRSVGLYHHKGCRRLVEVWRVPLTTRKA